MNGAAYVSRVMRPLSPVPTGMKPKLPLFEGITTVIFDVYGTLLISAAGDLDTTGRNTLGRLAMSEVNELVDGAFTGSEGPAAQELVRLLENVLTKKRAKGVEFPEVEMRIVWRQLLERYAPDYVETRIDDAALIYECHLNPVWEMPGAVNIVQQLAGKGITLGVISNAQDYTHSVFAGTMGGSFKALGFDPQLLVFSYIQGEGKPSLALYSEMKSRLSERGIGPESVLYVGNDMTKDIIPAAKVGFRTCLFAGDERSLRLGNLSEDEAGSKADAVVTDLNQICELLNS